ncbi:MAG: hypothetical protein FDX18_10725 [Chlorobium sp.]|nr:MAG: hypothetical protein FDX18_10725 [Chlorobium sp.]
MKRVLSLVAMFAVLSYASPASAELKFGGDVSVRVRDESFDAAHQSTAPDNLYYQYRARLNVAGDFEGGYLFRALISNEAPGFSGSGGANTTAKIGGGGGWQTVGYGNTELYTVGFSQLYFGRNYGESHYLLGRLPLNSTNNPVFDIHLYPKNPLDVPATTFNNDRLFGVNYGTKIGSGDLNVVVGVFDNLSKNNTSGTGDGALNDGYAAVVSYKTRIGDVTVEPQVLTALNQHDTVTQTTYSTGLPFHQGIRPVTFGANVSVPAGDVKLGFSGFHTSGHGTTPSSTIYANPGANVDYSGYLLRAKAEYGPFLAWYDYNKTTDRSDSITHKYTNKFVWAQYKIPAGKISIQPTVRYLTTSDNAATSETKTSRLRSELWATLTF